MKPTPVASGLIVCERVIVEAGTNRVSHITEFVVFEANQFPFTPRPFYVSAVLTGSQGTGRAVLNVLDLETDEVVNSVTAGVTLHDRFDELRVVFLLERDLVGPDAAICHQHTLEIDLASVTEVPAGPFAEVRL